MKRYVWIQSPRAIVKLLRRRMLTIWAITVVVIYTISRTLTTVAPPLISHDLGQNPGQFAGQADIGNKHNDTGLMNIHRVGGGKSPHIPIGLHVKLEKELRKSTACSILRPTAEEVKYKNGDWQVLQERDTEIFTYSAFYDDRAVVGEVPVIRILVVSLRAPSGIYCQVWYDDFSVPHITRATTLDSGRGELFGSKRYKQVLVSCALPTSFPIPSHVSLATKRCRHSSLYLPVLVDVRSTPEHEFAVCVAISFGQIPQNDFVEWMEFHRMLGVTEFNVYNGSISGEMKGLFKYYSDKNILRIFPMAPPIDDFTKKGVKLGSPASLNDCMMRNWYRYKYVIVIDLDEFIVPRKHSNYAAMLEAVDKDAKLASPWRSYTFRNVYYFRDLKEDDTQPARLTTMRYRQKVDPSRFLFASKSFINPRKCLSVFNHYCYRRFPSENSPPFTIDVNVSLATCHHYRKCGFAKDKCSNMMANVAADDVMLKYKAELYARTQKVSQEILNYY